MAHHGTDRDITAVQCDAVEAGCDSRMLSVAMRLWPPASSFALSPCSASSLTASSTERALAYANGAGFTQTSLILFLCFFLF
jgi:hypothetical protein